jgi:hypothetical protein
MVQVRVADMGRFDEKQLLTALYDRDLVPAWLETIKPSADFPAVAEDVLRHEAVKRLDGEWRTDDSASRKFWLSIHAGHIRLHTTKPGYWTSTRGPILQAGADSLRCAGDTVRPIDVKYKQDGETLTIHVPAPSAYQGEFKLFRGTGEGDKER